MDNLQHLKWISTETLYCKCHLLTSKSSKSSSTQKYIKPKEYSSFKDKVTFSWNPTAAKVWQSYRLEQEDTNFSVVLTFRPNTKVRQFQRHKKWNIFLDHNVCLILDVVSIHYQPLSNDLPPTAGHGQFVVHIGQISLAYPAFRRFDNKNAKTNSWNHLRSERQTVLPKKCIACKTVVNCFCPKTHYILLVHTLFPQILEIS